MTRYEILTALISLRKDVNDTVERLGGTEAIFAGGDFVSAEEAVERARRKRLWV